MPMPASAASVPFQQGQMVTPPITSSVIAPGSERSPQGARSPLAPLYCEALLYRGVDESALDEAYLEDLRLLMRHYTPDSSEGN